MRVSEFTIRTEELKASASLRQAALDMHKRGVDCLPVADNDHHFVGLLTADAVALATAADRRDPGRTRARRVMLTDCCHCYADEDVEDALRAMTERRARRSVVLDRDEHPIGILALGDLPVRNGHHSSIEAIMDCDQLEQNWLRAARKALGRTGPRSEARAGRYPGGTVRGGHFVVAPASGPDPVPADGTSGGLLPMSSFVEAYHDYHG